MTDEAERAVTLHYRGNEEREGAECLYAPCIVCSVGDEPEGI